MEQVWGTGPVLFVHFDIVGVLRNITLSLWLL